MSQTCPLCGCTLHREGDYARPTPKGRSHACEHHFVAERFFGRSGNRRGTQRDRVFVTCPWNMEGHAMDFCYECGEELLHNPVLLPLDVQRLAHLIQMRGLLDDEKTADRRKFAERVKLLHEVIDKGLEALLKPSDG